MNYNNNIQSVRAISLILVVLYHLQVDIFSFGYIGVDIFFLISGYLMPLMITKYSAWEFIKRRTIRLYPALSFVVFCALIIGYFLSMPGEYLSTAKSGALSLLFFSNIYFLFNTGYFDIDATLQPLLHTWSLGNEYLAYIVLFILILLLSFRKVFVASVILVIITACYILVSLPNIEYLDPIPRLFLFFVAFIYSTLMRGKYTGVFNTLTVSFLALTVTVIFYSESIVNLIWPNESIFIIPFVILPLLSMKKQIVSNIWAVKAVNLVGNWSYSIYLWHWFVISTEFSFLRNSSIIGISEFTLLLFLSVVLGVFSYYFIEKNIKLSKITTFLSMLGCALIIYFNGFENRVDAEVIQYARLDNMHGFDYVDTIKSSSLLIRVARNSDDSSHSTLVLGDSFSQHILPMLLTNKIVDEDRVFRLGLQPKIAISKWNEIDAFIDLYNIDRLIISYNLAYKNSDEMLNLIDLAFRLKGVKILLLRDPPSFSTDPVSCLISAKSSLLYMGCDYDIMNGLPRSKVYNAEDSVWKVVKSKLAPSQIIDTHAKLCNKEVCATFINSEFLMRDTIHFNEKLTEETNTVLGQLFFDDKD